jgi:hypothetical protein
VLDNNGTVSACEKRREEEGGDVGNVLHALQALEPVERNSRTSGDKLEERDTFLVAEGPDRSPEVADDRVRVREVDEVCNSKAG